MPEITKRSRTDHDHPRRAQRAFDIEEFPIVTGRRRAPTPRADAHRRLAVATAVLAVVTVAATIVAPGLMQSSGLVGSAPAEASSASSTLLSMLNNARQSQGLAPLASAGDLSAVAYERAQAMARSGALSHTPDLGGRVCCWSWLAENAAYGGSVQTLHSVLMGSPSHRANIMYADADDVGVAVVSSGGTLWAAQVFRARSDQTGSGGGGGGDGDRAGGASRDGDRSTTTSSYTGTTSSPTEGVTIVEAGPTAAEIAEAQLRDRLRAVRSAAREARQQRGEPLDPVRAAVRYNDVLARITG